jgi:hypothetical protein
MRQDNLRTSFNALPPEAQKQVLDFISFLESRYASITSHKVRRTRLSKEPFIGMWSDRKDMKDSAAWVRELRQREWNN